MLRAARERAGGHPIAAASVIFAVVLAAGWWYSRRVDGASIVAQVNARYSTVAGYESDIASSSEGSAYRVILKRRAVMVGGRLTEFTEESANPAGGKALRTFADASMLVGTVDGHSCWKVSSTDTTMISRDLGIGQPMIPATDRVVSARRGGHGYLIETITAQGSAQSPPTIWDIDKNSLRVVSRTIHTSFLDSRMTITQELPSAPPLVRPDVLCAR